jgi:O-antigen/teichoic acid export membrane protein
MPDMPSIPDDTAAFAWRERVPRLVEQLVMIALRMGNAGAKFALALYMTRYLGLADLGVYGLLVGAATTVPAVLGFGLNDWIGRLVVGLDRAQALPLAATRLAFTLAIHIVVQTAAWLLNSALGAPIPWPLAVPIGLILLLEHLAADGYALLIGRDRPQLANILLFLRAGAWPLVVIVWGLIDPNARTLLHVLYAWVAGLVVMWAVVAALFLKDWRLLTLRWEAFREGFRNGVAFYLNDIGAVGNLYLDRFLVSLMLGLELTGVYTFFWSVANVVHTLSVYGVIQPQMPKLVAATNARDEGAFVRLRKRLQVESWTWALVLSLALGLLVPFILPYLDRPLLSQHLAVLAITMVAVMLRIGADGFGFVLYALHHERWIAMTSLAAVALSAALNLAFIPLVGLTGAALAYVAVGGAMLAARMILVRRAHEAFDWTKPAVTSQA